MSLAESTRPAASTPQGRDRVSTVVGLLAAVLAGGFLLTSTLVSMLPEFRFESQFPALLPFFAWAGAVGVGHVANLARRLHRPWRDVFGLHALAPYLAVMVLSASAPQWQLPWWLAPIAAVSAAVPFLILAARARTTLSIDPARDADDASLRGTFVIGLALMLLAYAAAGPAVTGAIASVLLAGGLAVASMTTHGLARASRTWRLRHWTALAWGSLVVWASVLLRGLTSFFHDSWYVFTVVVLAGLPLILVNSAEARRAHRG